LKEKEGERIKPSTEVKPSTTNNKRKKRRHANIPTPSTIPTTSTSTDTHQKLNPPNTVEPAYKKHLGPDSKLLPKECERCLANGLCMLCGQKGHMAVDCPKRKQGTTKASLAKATITISAPISKAESKKL
jgi:Zinc knuckle